MNGYLLVVAAAVGALTGVISLGGHPATVAVHAAGGIVALGLVVLVAHRVRRYLPMILVAGMVAANVTGVVWTGYGQTDVTVVAHIVVSVLVVAGLLLAASEQHQGPDTTGDRAP
ncbi:MAG: hypothetical protein PPP58_03565 [Natronomonas sp.]